MTEYCTVFGVAPLLNHFKEKSIKPLRTFYFVLRLYDQQNNLQALRGIPILSMLLRAKQPDRAFRHQYGKGGLWKRAISREADHLRRQRWLYTLECLLPKSNSPEATQTSYINYMKPLILASELDIPHTISVVDTKEPWFQSVHPERMVPSLRDQDPQTLEDVYVFESTACLQYMADIYDKEGLWKGRTAAEKGTIHAWTAYQTAGLGCV